jgi:hypothetical protein
MRARGGVAAIALLALGGCGGGGAATVTQDRAPATGSASTTASRAIDRREAEGRARSAAAQDAVRQDYSIPPTAFAVRCAAAGGAARAARWACTARSRDERCRGGLALVVLVDGSTQARGELRCRGPRDQ